MSDEVVCTRCGHVGEAKRVTRGSFAIELILWLCLIVPGLIYSFWRLSTRSDACPACGNTELLPMSSPMAQKFLRENLPEQLAKVQEPYRPPSRAAQSAGRALGRLVGKVVK